LAGEEDADYNPVALGKESAAGAGSRPRLTLTFAKGGVVMDAITLLKEDHKAVKRLFRQFERSGDGASAKRAALAEKIIEELSVHAAIEEQLFYPAARAAVPDALDHVLESLEEHHVVKWVLSELEDLEPTDERFKAKMTVLIENVEHHAEEEENELFPKVRKALGRKPLSELGQAMEKAKRSAPKRPHPRMPDTPPGNVLAAPVATVVDAARNTGKRATRSAAKSARGRR
jgi:hemerythrin superfamily protein